MYLDEKQLAEIISKSVNAVLDTQDDWEPDEAELETDDKLGAEEYTRMIGGRMRICRPAKHPNGTPRRTTDGRPIQEVVCDVSYPWGDIKTAPVILDGKETQLPLSLGGALFVEAGNGVFTEIRGAHWQGVFHPLAYKENIHGVFTEGFEQDYGKLPEEPPVVDTGVKQAVKWKAGNPW